jgi:uncharacterized membrane protein YiaA
MRSNLAVFLVGLAAFSIGLYMAWPPLGPIGLGLVLMTISAVELREGKP